MKDGLTDNLDELMKDLNIGDSQSFEMSSKTLSGLSMVTLNAMKNRAATTLELCKITGAVRIKLIKKLGDLSEDRQEKGRLPDHDELIALATGLICEEDLKSTLPISAIALVDLFGLVVIRNVFYIWHKIVKEGSEGD